ncbi:MAG: hypothetical protein R2713_18560 [Ilumatobacteraceae bacterium]
MADELWRRGALELAGMIARKVSSEEVVRAHLARIDEVNPKLNAVSCDGSTTLAGRGSLAAAVASDAPLASARCTGCR